MSLTKSAKAKKKTKATNDFVRVAKSSVHGYGGFARCEIEEGTRIIEYLGERISHDEATRRHNENGDPEEHHTFLFTVNEEVVIDARFEGNEAKFINHSCDPNCEAVLEDDRIFIETLREIGKGQELTIDYQLERDEPNPEEWLHHYHCNCGSEHCRGSMLAPKYFKKKRKQAKKATGKKTSKTKRTK